LRGRYFSRRSARSTAAPNALRCTGGGSDYASTWSAVSAEHQGACSMTWGSVSADRSIIASGFHPALSPNSRPIRRRNAHSCGNRLSISRSKNASSLGRCKSLTRSKNASPFGGRLDGFTRSKNASPFGGRLDGFTEVIKPALSGAGWTASPRREGQLFRGPVGQLHEARRPALSGAGWTASPRSTSFSHRIRLLNFIEVGRSALSGAERPASVGSDLQLSRESKVQLHRGRIARFIGTDVSEPRGRLTSSIESRLSASPESVGSFFREATCQFHRSRSVSSSDSVGKLHRQRFAVSLGRRLTGVIGAGRPAPSDRV